MNPKRYTVCLNMIVKNEAHVIERCLASVLPIIDHWVIVDTGSTDGTQEVIKEFMKDIPGTLYERPWKDFGTNRSEALSLARATADYCLIIDADERFETAPDFSWAHLNGSDCFTIGTENHGTYYQRCQLMNNRLEWNYVGVLHEYPFAHGAGQGQVYPGITTIVHHDGARSTNPQKFKDDAQLLKKALKADPNNARHMFYLAQSYRDAGAFEKAIKAYQKRVKMGGWVEEVWLSLYQIAELKRLLQKPWPKIMEAYLKAYEALPDRAEPLYDIACYYTNQKDYHTAYLYLKPAAERPLNLDHLFIEPNIYLWKIPMDYAVCCYHLGLHNEALAVYDRLLLDPFLTEEQRVQVRENRGWSVGC